MKHDNPASDGSTTASSERLLTRWVDRVRGIVLKDAEPASRAYRYMARLIDQDFSAEGGGVCLAFASTDNDKVSTDALLMLAYCLRSELKSRVLLIDARLKEQSSGITGRLGLLGMPGFAEVLLDQSGNSESMVCESSVPDVDVLPAGDPAGTGRTPMDLEKLRQFLGLARTLYDHVLVQIGSPLRDTRALMTAGETQAVFLIAEENRTFMKTLDNCRNVLLINGIKDVRVVVAGGRP